MMNFKIYSVSDYKLIAPRFESVCTNCKTIEDATNLLKKDKFYHVRFLENVSYVFCIDLDNCSKPVTEVIDTFILFMKDVYGIDISSDDFSYTTHTEKVGNYHHISIPKLNATFKKQKEIVSKFINSTKINLDTNIYKECWFRLPNQTKGFIARTPNANRAPHQVTVGKMEDFVLSYIPQTSVCIEDVIAKNKSNSDDDESKPEQKPKKKEKVKVKKNNLDGEDKENKTAVEKPQTQIINLSDEDSEKIETEFTKSLFNLLNKEYYTKNEYWYKLLMAVKRHEKNTGLPMLEIFKDFCKRGKDTYNEKEILEKWKYYETYDIKITLKILHEYAKTCDLQGYYSVCREYYQKKKIDITDKYLAEKIKETAGHLFFYKNKDLYCFDTENNFWYVNNSDVLKKFINTTLYDTIIHFLIDAVPDPREFDILKRELRRKCLTISGQKDVVEGFKIHFGRKINDDIEFDQKCYLLGFNNGVIDLKTKEFRDRRYDDYMTTSTGYKYKKAVAEDIKIVSDMFDKVETKKEKKKLLLQLLATGLIGKSSQKFIIFNGEGGNGKSWISKFMEHTLGDYFYKGDIKSLCEDSTSDADPKSACMDKKRYVVFTEPENDKKIRNGKMKSWTGDKTINARKCFSNETKIQMMATIVLECNKKIQLKDEATEGEARRIIDYLFESKFVEDDNKVDEKNRHFKGDKKYEGDEPYIEQKYAFLQILIDAAHEFIINEKEQFSIPDEVKTRSDEYIAGSFFLITMLKENTIKTDNKEDCITIADLYDKVKTSDYYLNLTKEEKRKITKKYMVDFYQKNKMTLSAYKETYRPYVDGNQLKFNNVLIGYKIINDE